MSDTHCYKTVQLFLKKYNDYTYMDYLLENETGTSKILWHLFSVQRKHKRVTDDATT